MKLQAGTLLKKRYRIQRELGRGGQGAVYLCEDLDVYRQPKAVKQLLDLQQMAFEERRLALQMFEREGEFLARLTHPGLPQISDKFTVDGRCYLVLEFVNGKNLEMLLKEEAQRFDEATTVQLALELCGILEYMHAQNPPIVFRDLKPENIILTEDKRVKLIDFGIARTWDKRKKQDTIQVGTVGYAAPEQYSGSTDPRSDIYSFGALLHHLLTGVDPKRLGPFEAEKIPVRSVKPTLSAHIEGVVQRTLTANRRKRFSSVKELRLALLQSPLVTICPVCGAVALLRDNCCSGCGSEIELPRTALHGKPQAFYLEAVNAGRRTTVFLDKTRLKLGRSPENDIIIGAPGVSGFHAELERHKDRFIIRDLDSTNGTYINGRKIKEKKLKPDAKISMGDTEFFFRVV